MAASTTTSPVCVTGASGFIAGHLVAQLLDRGYKVHGTVRSLKDPAKTKHLTELPGAAERLTLFEADLLTPGSFETALEGCEHCHHTASPFFNDGITDPDAQLIRPALEGTLNVLRSCKKLGIKTITVTSSTAAIYGMKGGIPDGHVFTEEHWADDAAASAAGAHYVVSKILAEKAVWDFAEKEFPEARIVVLNPTLVIGPMYQPVMNTSSGVISEFLTGQRPYVPSARISLVDVRDVALAHILAAENPSATGRFLLVSGIPKWAEVLDTVRTYADDDHRANVPTSVPDASAEPAWRYNMVKKFTVDTTKAQTVLGLKFRSPEESVKDLCENAVFRSVLAASA